MQSFAVVVKAGIVVADQLLVLTPADPQRRQERDLPGGRLEFGEDPMAALNREVAEETGLTIEPVAPVRMWSFQRSPEVHIVGVTWACRALSNEVRLSPEHVAFEWVKRDEITLDWPECAELTAIFGVLDRYDGGDPLPNAVSNSAPQQYA